MSKKRGLILLIIGILLCSLFVPCLVVVLTEYNQTNRLIQAIKSENVSEVKEVLAEGTNPNRTDIMPSAFWSLFETTPQRPLTVACTVGNLEIVRLLIDHGATAEYREETGFSPLRATLLYYQPDDPKIVELLLSNGASIDHEEGEFPAFYAARMVPREYDVHKANGTVFVGGYDEESAVGITEIVATLSSVHGIDSTDSTGKTLLMIGVKSENTYLVQHLIEKGCDLSIVDNAGRTAWDYAQITGNQEIIGLF